jgi:ribosomal protein L40E
MGYLICDKCGGYYELQSGEKPEDFDLTCDCGGKLRYTEKIETKPTTQKIVCLKCGTENPEIATFCAECGENLLKKPEQESEKSSNEIMDSWNKLNLKTKIVFAFGLFIILAIKGISISGSFQPTFEDKLIEYYEQGGSQSALTDYIAAHSRAVEVTLRKNTDDPTVLDEELKNLKAIETFQLQYINGQISSNELKEFTYPLYQEYNDLKNLEHLTGE